MMVECGRVLEHWRAFRDSPGAMSQSAPYRIRSALAGLVAGFAALFAAWKTGQPPPPTFADYYEGSVAPLLDASARRDSEATNAAIARLDAHFAHFQSGIPAFAEDITGWGTRFGIVGRSVKDLWTKFWNDPAQATATKNYVNEKFRAHIVSEEKLQLALAETLAVFHETVAANRNRLLAEVQLALSAPECPVRVPPLRMEVLLRESAIASEKLSATQSGDNLFQSAALVSSGVVADVAAKRLIAAIFTRLAATTAASIATEGSAAAGATATGGAAGTVAGPAGTVIGIGVGIVAAVIMDWWMTDSFKTKLHEQCSTFLTKLELDIAAGSQGAPGLRKSLEDAATANSAAFRAALNREISKPLP